MDDLQEQCIRIAQEGHNLIITGQAGTGKTALLKKTIAVLEGGGKTVSVLGTTGMASTLLPHGTTLHSFCGMKDGRYNTDELIRRFQEDESYESKTCKIQTN
jgi:ABC-type cobalamin/Fe3+-siderophores transport system ATPase subunit